MGLAQVYSRALNGIHAPEVVVEVHTANGLPQFTLVGLPDTEVKEARDRVRAAIITSGFEFPQRRITVNLAPADLPKESGRFDLPIALGVLAASEQIPSAVLQQYEFAGELGLNGELRAIRGALAMCWQAQNSQRHFVLPVRSATEAAVLPKASIFAARSLAEVCAFLHGQGQLQRISPQPPCNHHLYADLADIKGQQQGRRALEISAAGGHSLLLIGPPGAGKSMLAQRLPGLLPPLSETEALESAAILSLSSQGFDDRHFSARPFRSPHHTASSVAMVGGGSQPKPGEISLAHHGVLFLDELPEFDRKVLEVLREPLESRRISISRANRQTEFPAAFQLIAAMNPCPCGYHGSNQKACQCSPEQVKRYRNRLSGPLLDRIDVLLEIPALSNDELLSKNRGENSECVRNRVREARQRQLDRQGKLNSELAGQELDQFTHPEAAAEQLLRQAIDKLHLSARAYHRILKVARTIADLSQVEKLQPIHISEAITLRRWAGG
jgi:magnesium chelatase family protein